MGAYARLLLMASDNVVDERTDLRAVPEVPLEFSAELAQHGPVLLATARFLAGNEHDAQDLVQTTYELALRNVAALRDRGRLLAWLIRIETREAFRLRRRLRRLVNQPAPDVVYEEVPGNLLVLREALARLPRRERTAIVLHHMVGLPVADTAEAMTVSPNTVKSQLKSGLSHLREAMK
jgi:RNA polymerase sigma factor (sigma-70 family)